MAVVLSIDWIPGNRTDVQSWHVDRDSYLHHTGRTHSNAIEQVRRSKNQCYANALEQLRNHRKKTCDPQGVIDYMTVALDMLPVVGDEVMHISFFVLLATHQFFITYVQHFINRSVT